MKHMTGGSIRRAQLHALKQRDSKRNTGTDASPPVNREQRRAAQKGKRR